MPEKILIVDDDLDTLRLVGLMLQKQGFLISAASSGPQGIELAIAESPDLILLDVMMPGMDGYEVTRRLRSNEKTLDIPIMMFTAKSQLEDKVAGFEAGVDDYITKPTHPTELHAHVKALLARSLKKKSIVAGKTSTESAYVIGIIAVRGGLGVTTIAINLAASLSKRTGSEIALAEFRPGQGTLCYDLGINKPDGLNDLLNTPVGEITSDLIEEKFFRIPEGVMVLPASPRPKDAGLLKNIEHFETILNHLNTMSKYVVVDMGSSLTTLNQLLVNQINEIIVVVEPFENSLQQSQALLDDLMGLGVDRSHVFVAVNYRLRSDNPQLSVMQIQSHIKAPIEMGFTPAPELYQQASRRNLVACQITMESLTALQFTSLAEKIESHNHKPV
ncbi:MAG: response regulator [Chloroflexota bacterium]